MKVLFACFITLLFALPVSAQRHKKKHVANPCAIPLPVNQRPDTITKYIFGMTNKTILVKSIPFTKPKDNNILHSKYGTITWLSNYTKEPSHFIKATMKPYTITDTVEISFFGMKHIMLEFEDKKVKGYFAYQNITGENECYFIVARNKNKRKKLLQIVEVSFK